MLKIRNNVFETNSSSTHSLVILSDSSYINALRAVEPTLAEKLEEYLGKEAKYTREEIEKSFADIGATLKDEVLDLTNVDPEHFDFGYTGGKAYSDPAHKLLFVLTMFEDDGFGYHYDPDYFKDSFKETLKELGIKEVINPKDGFTGIDHQSREEIIDAVKYDIPNFLLRKDYVLVLDHD